MPEAIFLIIGGIASSLTLLAMTAGLFDVSLYCDLSVFWDCNNYVFSVICHFIISKCFVILLHCDGGCGRGSLQNQQQ